jgi:hypothetical protein
VSLQETIEAAFKNTPYPGDKNITTCQCPECEKIGARFRGTTWRDHTLDQLQQHQTAISLFSPEALRFFLPAFMVRSLGRWWDVTLMPFFIAQQFVPRTAVEDAVTKRHREARWNAFSPEQHRAIAAYLKEYAASESVLGKNDVQRAIARLEGRETS